MNNLFLEKYSNAKKSLIDLSTHDSTAIIALERGYIGITRILICLHELGITNAKCNMVALPDFTFTKHVDRWRAGFPYGCITSIDSMGVPFIPIDFRPNCCGVLMAEISQFKDDLYSLKEKLNSITKAHKELNETDFKRSNHFIGIYEFEQKYYLLIHGSLDYVKSILYNDRNNILSKRMKTRSILGYEFNYLIDEDAYEYYRDFLTCEELTMHFREILAQELYPELKILFNRTHEGFYGENTILLGGYASPTPFSCPIMMSPGSDLSIVHIDKPIQLLEQNLYCTPHGGGYALNEVVDAFPLTPSSPSLDYTLIYSNGAKLLSDDFSKMPYYYRTNTDKYWCHKYNMGSIKGTMRPIINLKI